MVDRPGGEGKGERGGGERAGRGGDGGQGGRAVGGRKGGMGWGRERNAGRDGGRRWGSGDGAAGGGHWPARGSRLSAAQLGQSEGHLLVRAGWASRSPTSWCGP